MSNIRQYVIRAPVIVEKSVFRAGDRLYHYVEVFCAGRFDGQHALRRSLRLLIGKQNGDCKRHILVILRYKRYRYPCGLTGRRFVSCRQLERNNSVAECCGVRYDNGIYVVYTDNRLFHVAGIVGQPLYLH